MTAGPFFKCSHSTAQTGADWGLESSLRCRTLGLGKQFEHRHSIRRSLQPHKATPPTPKPVGQSQHLNSDLRQPLMGPWQASSGS